MIGVTSSSIQKHKATRFETGEYLNLGNTTQLDFGISDPWSNSLWFRTSAAQIGAFFLRRAGSPSFTGYATSIQVTGALRLRITSQAFGSQEALVDTNSTWADDDWHHAVFTYNGNSNVSGMKIYVDGVVRATTTLLNNITTNITGTRTAYIAGDVPANTSFFAGDLDEVAVYDKELSLSEIGDLYNNGNAPDLRVAGPTANLVGYWRMGEGAIYPTIPDDSSNSNDGTMIGMESTDFIYYVP